MSDFDKEAERERLREKYEREEEKREVTERMSELLLKGATMTNAHCQDCGDPIFRYDGQEFCATCQKAVERDTGGDGAHDADEADDGDAETNGDREEIEVTSPGGARVQFGDDDAAEDHPAATSAEEPIETDVHADSQPREPPREQEPPADAGAPSGAGDLQTAHASLSREVARLAQQAEACEDLGQERELLAATREAAEALAAVREAGR